MFRRSLCGFLLFLLLSMGLSAQVNQFLNASQYTVGLSPMAAASGDFNRDGKLDLVVTNKVDGTVSVLLANGDGTFQSQVAYDLGAVPAAVAVADVNGDSDLDVVVALPAKSNGDPNNQVAVLLGKGDGTLQPPLYYDAGTAPQFVAVQDLNGDGSPDLVVANTGTQIAPGNNVSVLINVAGTFPTHVEYPTGNGPASVAIGDFNNNGNADLAVANSLDGTVSVLRGNGNGTYKPQTVYLVGSDPMAVAAGDFNADGKLDLAVGNFNDQTVSILIGNGNGIFSNQVTFATAFGEPYAIVVADFNGDQKADLAVSNAGVDSVGILLGNGDGSFRSHVDYWAGNGPGLLVAGDFNGDSKVDLAVPNYGWAARADNKLTMLLGNGDGTLRSELTYPTGDTPVAVASGDLNNDGYPDLVTANSIDDNVSVLLGNGDGTYQVQGTYSVGNNPSAGAVGDFNGDGKLDLAVANRGTAKVPGNTVSILLGNGDGTFPQQPSSTYTVGTSPSAIAVGEFNKDGKLDLLVSNNGESTLSMLLGNGDGSFQAQLTSATSGRPAAFAVGDLNGDGIPDVAVVLPNGDKVATLLGNGDGTFLLSSQAAAGNKPVSVALGDFNGDGKLDAAVANSSDNTMSVLLGNGDGTLQNQVAYSTGLAPSSVIAADFSSEGRIELLVANQQDNTASLFRSNGDGTFQPPLTYGLGWVPVALAAVDVNDDGALDVATADSGGRSTSVLLNARGSKMTLSSSAPNSVYGEAVTLTSTVAATLSWQPTPTGSVTFLDGNNVLGDAPLSGGAAVLNTATLTAGSHTLSAAYSGDTNFQPHRSAPIDQKVDPASTTVTLASSANPSDFGESVTFRASVLPEVSGLPTGTVTFLDGTIPFGSGPLANGVASVTISTLTVGTHNITAGYGGDLNFTGSTSPALNQVVIGQDFSIEASALLAPVIVGESGSSTVTVTSIYSFSAPVTLKCSAGLPSGAGCAFNPPSPIPAPNGTVTSALTITTANTTPAGSYTITITGTSGTLSHDYSSLALSVADFKVDGPASTSPGAIMPGQTAVAEMTVSSISGFANVVLLSCSGLPSGVSCLFNPASLTPSASGATSSLTISTASSTSAGAYVVSVMGTSGTLVRSYSSLAFNVSDFKVSAPSSTSPASISAGESATATITRSSLYGFAESVALTCSVSPAASRAPTCSLNPDSISPSGSSGTSTLTVNTTGATASLTPPVLRHDLRPLFALLLPISGCALLGVGLAGGGLRRRRLLGFLFASLLTASLTFQVACGGGSSSGGTGGTPGTPSGSYTVTVTGTSGSGSLILVHKTTVAITVQ